MKILHPRKMYNKITRGLKNWFVYWLIPDSWYLRWKYKKVFHRELNLKNPQTFSEKINWLKLNDRNPNYHLLVDKLRVKPIVSELIGREYIIPTIGGGIRQLVR